MSPKLSVVMSCRNHEMFIEQSVLSILNQTFSDFEFLIFDDNSSDNTYDILRNLSKKDSRIKLFRNNSIIGLTKNLNTLISLSKSNVIARQDADDLSTINRFEIFFNTFNNNFSLYTSNFYLEQEKGTIVTEQSDNPIFVLFNFLFYFYFGSHGQIFFSKKFYNEKFRYCQDYEFCSEILRKKHTDFSLIKDPLYVYKRHDNTIFCRHRKKQIYFSLITAKNNIKHFLSIDMDIKTILELRNMFLDHIKPNVDKNIILPVLNNIKERLFNNFTVKNTDKTIINDYINQTIKISYEK